MALGERLAVVLDDQLERRRGERGGEREAGLAVLGPDHAAVLRLEARQLEPDRRADLELELGHRHIAVGGQVQHVGVDDRRPRLAQARGEVDDPPLGRSALEDREDGQLGFAHKGLLTRTRPYALEMAKQALSARRWFFRSNGARRALGPDNPRRVEYLCAPLSRSSPP